MLAKGRASTLALGEAMNASLAACKLRQERHTGQAGKLRFLVRWRMARPAFFQGGVSEFLLPCGEGQDEGRTDYYLCGLVQNVAVDFGNRHLEVDGGKTQRRVQAFKGLVSIPLGAATAEDIDIRPVALHEHVML